MTGHAQMMSLLGLGIALGLSMDEAVAIARSWNVEKQLPSPTDSVVRGSFRGPGNARVGPPRFGSAQRVKFWMVIELTSKVEARMG